MTHPAFTGSFAHLKLGRKAVKKDARTLKLSKYLDDAVVLPQLPDRCDWTLGVQSWPMYGNDTYGDCTCAAVGHLIQAWTHRTPDDKAVLDLYWSTGDGTDDGRYEIDVLNYWRQTGVAGDKITAYAAIDASNLDHVRAGIFLFGGVYTGIALPQTAQTQTTWDVNGDPTDQNGPAYPGSWGGHAVPYESYDPDGFDCITWAHPLRLTNAFHSAYTDEVYAVISADWLNASGKTPDGFDIDQLTADLKALGTRGGKK